MKRLLAVVVVEDLYAAHGRPVSLDDIRRRVPAFCSDAKDASNACRAAADLGQLKRVGLGLYVPAGVA